MSNIAGKAYAMNLLTPVKSNRVWINKFIFWIAGLPFFEKKSFGGLRTLSLIHYARWVIFTARDIPDLGQPKEKLKYAYMLFFSNFNGSWTQYVDSFSMAIPGGLNLLWHKVIRWPRSVPQTPFNKYVITNQIWTDHYYNAYPLATSNDIKSAMRVKAALLDFRQLDLSKISGDDFVKRYNKMLLELQSDISRMEDTPVVSLATEEINKRVRIDQDLQ